MIWIDTFQSKNKKNNLSHCIECICELCDEFNAVLCISDKKWNNKIDECFNKKNAVDWSHIEKDQIISVCSKKIVEQIKCINCKK